MKKLPIDYISSRNKNYFLFKQDIGLTSTIRNGHRWEEHLYELIKDINFENSTIIDIGANLGAHTLEFADLVGDDGKVYAFEPQRIVYYQLCANIIANGYNNIYAINKAISDKNGTTHIEKQNFYTNDLLNIGDTHISDYGEEVDEIKLDDYNLNNVSLIKMDVQGYEHFVLNGAIETIERNKPIILIEILEEQLNIYNKTFDDIKNFFKENQYTLKQIDGIDYIATPKKSKKIEHFYQNIDGWFDFEDIYTDMVNKYDNALFVELGAAWGKSSSYMAVEIANSTKNIKFDVIDKWEDDNDSTIEKFLENTKSIKNFINPIKGYTTDIVKKYEDNSIDFLFIDASHTYEDVLNDINLWYHKVKTNGIIAGHDYNWGDFPDVPQAVNDYFGQENIKISKWSWIYNKNIKQIPEHGRGGFIPSINYIKEFNIKNPVIVEIGTQRDFNNTGDGCSTTFFSWFVNTYGGKLYSIDIENIYINNGKIELKNKGLLTNRINLICDDGINFFNNFNEKIDILYLDAWDYRGSEEDKKISEEKHLECFIKAENFLNDTALVLIDDILNIETYEGKGHILIPYLINKNYKILLKEWQFLFVKNNNISYSSGLLEEKDNKILVFSCCFNEEKILPFYLDYYTNFIKADKIVIYDGGSTDNSQNIIKEYPNVDLIIDIKNKLDDRYLNDTRNNGWKPYKNDYDWIIVCDIDEFIYHPNFKDKLLEYNKNEITIPLTEGFDMISEKFPTFKKGKYLPSIVKIGNANPIFLNKKSIFKSSIDINYHIGSHGCDPVGNVKYSELPEIKHLHFKWLSHEYLTKRSAGVANRLSDWNLSGGCGSHNRPLSLITIEEYKNILNSAIEIINDFPIDYKIIDHIYQNIDGWFDFESTYKEMVEKAIENSHFVEVGSWLGKSTSYMAVEIANSMKKIKFDAVDTWEGSPNEDDCHKNIIKTLEMNLYDKFLLNMHPVIDYINPKRGLSEDISKQYKDNSLDFVFLDASHDYDSVKNDIISWYPKIKNNGIMAGHDYNDFGTDGHEWIGVVKAVNEFFGKENITVRKVHAGTWVVEKQKIEKLKIKQPKISVIIPTYNRFNLLKESIQSVFNQNYENFEILVCHDGYSDEYEKFKKENIHNKIFYYEVERRNNYGAAQRNFMLDKVTGDYILHLDDDNIIYDNYFEKMINQIDDNTGMVVCRIHFNDKEWFNYILPLEDELKPCFIDQLSILFKSDIGKSFKWDDYFGHDHRYITNCENVIKERNLKIKYIPDILANHRFFGTTTPKITIIHHCYLRYNWKNILEEQILLMKNNDLYDSCSEIFTTIYADDKNNIVEFKNIISREDTLNKWNIIELEQNNYEFDALKFIKKYCEDKHSYICYFHLKGVISNEIEPNIGIPTWRKYLNYFTIEKWKNNVEKLKNNDVVCVDWNFNDMHQKYVLGGHFFWTKSEYIRTLPEPVNNENRFLSEIWITSNDEVKVYENFNYEKIGYKNLYLQIFSPSLYRNDIKLDNNNPVIVMTSHPNFKTSEEITKQSLESLNPLNIDTILSTHCPISLDLQKTATHFIYDKNNPLIKHDYYDQSWFNNEDYYALIKLHKNDNDLQHALAVYINYYNGILHAKSLGYTTAICTNFDLIFDEDDLNIITNKINEMNQTDKKSFFLTSNPSEGIHYKTIFFITDIDFFLENFKYVTNENDYNKLTREVGSETNCLENFFYQTLKNSDKLLLQQIEEKDLFSKSKINLFSNIEYFTILSNRNDSNSFIVWFSSSNSLDDNRDLTIKILEGNDVIFLRNDKISKNYAFFKKIEFKRNYIYTIICNILYDNIIKDKKIIIDNNSFDKLYENGEFWNKKNEIKDINFLIENSNSQAKQDIFAYYMCETNNGYFLDFGSQHPIQINNTYLLEKMGWDGISFDIENSNYQMRKTKFICCDLTLIDIDKVLSDNNVPKLIDYVSIDIDDSTEKFIFNFPFNKYEFKVITIEHDLYKNEIDKKEKIQKLLIEKGYTLVCNNVSVESKDVLSCYLNDSNLYPFEDWYVNKKYINENRYNLLLSDNLVYNDIIKKLI